MTDSESLFTAYGELQVNCALSAFVVRVYALNMHRTSCELMSDTAVKCFLLYQMCELGNFSTHLTLSGLAGHGKIISISSLKSHIQLSNHLLLLIWSWIHRPPTYLNPPHQARNDHPFPIKPWPQIWRYMFDYSRAAISYLKKFKYFFRSKEPVLSCTKQKPIYLVVCPCFMSKLYI